MPALKTNNGEIHYHLYGFDDRQPGFGDSVIFILSGMAFSAKVYGDLAEIFASAKVSVITMDHRDIAPTTAKGAELLTIHDINKDIVAILRALNLKSVHFLGESYGGMLAMGMAIRFPECVKSLCIVNSSIAGQRQMRLAAPAVMRLLRSLSRPAKMYEAIAEQAFASESTRHRPELIKTWLKIHEGEKVSLAAVRKQLVAAASFHPTRQLKKLNIPTLIIYGPQDRLVSPNNSFVLHRLIPGAALTKIDGGGHHLCYEHKNEIAQEYISFLNARHML